MEEAKALPKSTTESALEAALDDLDGLFEAFQAIADSSRKAKLVRKDSAKSIRRELGAAADAYAAALIATSHGDLDMKRVKTCRKTALDAMPTAAKRRKALSKVVVEKRLPAGPVRDDLRDLIQLSLHSRAAVTALAPTVDKRAATSIGNKVLVELRQATLLYLKSARDAGDGATDKPRLAVVPYLEKSEAHAKGLEALAASTTGGSVDTLGVSLSREVVGEVHGTHLKWAPGSAAD